MRVAKIARAPSRPAKPADESPEDVLIIPDGSNEDEEKLSEFLASFGGKEYKVRVDEFNATDKAWEHLDTYPLDGFEPYEVCKRSGRGRYRLTFLNERGKYIAGGQPQIRIGGLAAAALAPAPAAAALPAPENDPLKNPLVTMMLANAEAARRENAELVRAILTRPEPARSSTAEVLSMVKELRDLSPKEDGAMKKMMDALVGRLIERGLDPEQAAGAGGVMSEIREGLGMLKEAGVLERLGKTRAPAAAALPRRVIEAAPRVEDTKVDDPIAKAMRPYVSIFKMKFENGVSPEDAGGYLLDESYESLVPLIKKHVAVAALASAEQVMDNLAGRASDPAQVEHLFTFAPELMPCRDWCLAVISAAVTQWKNPAPEESQS